jgi:pantetheine-phosphate adenylyltransferase
MRTAIYPGSFDPVTLGHLNIIKRAAEIFDKVIVCVLVNSSKNGFGLFDTEERMELIRRVTQELPNVEVDFSTELLASYAKRKNAQVLVKGLRAMSDYEQEVQMALINSKLYPKLDTVFLPSSPKYTYLSSSVVKEMARYGADLTEFLPREIIDDVIKKTGTKVKREGTEE